MDAAGLNAIQAANELDVDFLSSDGDLGDAINDKVKEKVEKPEYKKKFNYSAVVSAAFLFIVIIAWFEVLRIYFEYKFVNDPETKRLLNEKYKGQAVYALFSTFIVSIILCFIIYKNYI